MMRHTYMAVMVVVVETKHGRDGFYREKGAITGTKI